MLQVGQLVWINQRGHHGAARITASDPKAGKYWVKYLQGVRRPDVGCFWARYVEAMDEPAA